MSNKAPHMADLHFEHEMWTKELAFMKGEISFFEKQLEEMVSRYTDPQVLSQMESFQNRFVKHKETIQRVEIEIRDHEKELERYAIEHPVAIDHVAFADHAESRDHFNTERVMYAELKSEYFRFMAKWM